MGCGNSRIGYQKDIFGDVAGLQTRSVVLRDVMGIEEHAGHLLRRCTQVDAIERGLLEGEMFLARAV